MWTHKKIEETAKRLKSIREELQFHVICSTASRIDAVHLKSEEDQQRLIRALQTITSTIPEMENELATVIKSETTALQAQIARNEMKASQKHNETTVILERIDFNTRSLSQISVQATADDTLKSIKERLLFNQRQDRFDDIDAAHRKTFEWILEPPTCRADEHFSDFHGWLLTGCGVYWVGGKAGSGKSTLMKLIRSRCEEPLKLWAGEMPLLLLTFFSWSAGSPLQRTHEGLFRSLLFDALTQRPDLGPVMFPD